ncbi:MAG: T9SS type A sorting domain-containing protein [Chitinophagales bacterium]|nr:T9SS type A sorting domain-containing protein [Chitinophagales bacterium]
MKRPLVLAGLLQAMAFSAPAQHVANHQIPVTRSNNQAFAFPWVGGLNNAQFSEGDLNNDGIADLFVFDRTGNKVLTFLNGGTVGKTDYQYAPAYEAGFPTMTDWALLEDYNCDNIPDIWCFTRGPLSDPGFGIQVYQGYYDSNNRIQFVNADSLLKYPVNSLEVNLFVSPIDIPAIVDVNNDGDKDVLTFQITGGFLMYFENLSKEGGQGCDTLRFVKKDDCWGDFYESGFYREVSLNEPCPFQLGGGGGEAEASTRLHAGSTVLAWDFDSNGTKDVVLGDISFTNLVFLDNCGTPADANMCAQDTLFPSYDVSADVFVFPAAFLADVNNDGLKDLLVTPNAAGGSENYHCVWHYRNQGTSANANFTFQSDTFLVGDMLDFGEGCYAVFFDANADGLLDIVAANRGYFRPDLFQLYSGQIAYLQNTGTAQQPAFRLVTTDYSQISDLGITALVPTFGDLDGDGDADLLTGKEDGTLLYFKNTAQPGAAPKFTFHSAMYGNIDVGNFSAPQLVDVNRDGLLDLVIGEESGNLNYYENTGSASQPKFTLKTNFFGAVKVNLPGYPTGYSVPFLFDHNDGNGWQLLVGGERGTLMHYKNIDGNLDGAFTLVDSVYAGIRAGYRSTVSGADVNADGLVDLLVGNYRGGMTFYDSKIVSAPLEAAADSVMVFPNPAGHQIQIQMPYPNARVLLMDALGRQRKEQLSPGQSLGIDVTDLPQGWYTVHVVYPTQRLVANLLLVK